MSKTTDTTKVDNTTKNLDEFMKKQEAKGEQQVKELLINKGINLDSSKGQFLGATSQVLNSISNGSLNQSDIKKIIQQGADEFYKETGRNMTYGEMRDMYG